MKIVTINGQNHHGSSYHIGKEIANQLEGEITEFFLPKDLNGFCLGCYKCLKDETKCYMYEKKKIIWDAMEDADLIIFTTPNYCMYASAPMKSFLDFSFDMWMVHRPKAWMFKKKVVIISTSAGASNKTAINTIKSSVKGWGVSYIKTIGKAVHANKWDVIPEKDKKVLDKKINKVVKDLKKNKPVRASLSTKISFKFFGFLHKKDWDSDPCEKEYWNEKGWLDKNRPWK